MRCYMFLRLTGLTCSKVPGFWMVEHQLVFLWQQLMIWFIVKAMYIIMCINYIDSEYHINEVKKNKTWISSSFHINGFQ